jgi:hypothetical protein
VSYCDCRSGYSEQERSRKSPARGGAWFARILGYEKSALYQTSNSSAVDTAMPQSTCDFGLAVEAYLFTSLSFQYERIYRDKIG